MYVYMYQLRFELAASNIKPQQWLKQKRSLFPFLVLSKAGSWQLASVTASQSSELQQALSVVLLPILNIKLYLGCSPEGLQQGPGTECLLSKYRGLGPCFSQSNFLQSQVCSWSPSTDEPKQRYRG